MKCNNCDREKDQHILRSEYCDAFTAERFTPLRCNYRYSCRCLPIEDKKHHEYGYLCNWHWRVVQLGEQLDDDPSAKIDLDLEAQHRYEQEMKNND